MGYYEYLVYPKNKKISLDKLMSLLTNHDFIDVICSTEVKDDIYSDKIKVFGIYERKIKPVNVAAGTKGIIIGSEAGIGPTVFSLLNRLRCRFQVICLDDIMLSCNSNNLGKRYEDYFTDSPTVAL